MVYKVAVLPSLSVADFNPGLLPPAYTLVSYLVAANLKDIAIFLYHFIHGSRSKAFIEALTVHAYTLVFDILAIVAINIWTQH